LALRQQQHQQQGDWGPLSQAAAAATASLGLSNAWRLSCQWCLGTHKHLILQRVLPLLPLLLLLLLLLAVTVMAICWLA
jgi:hypothetical protein